MGEVSVTNVLMKAIFVFIIIFNLISCSDRPARAKFPGPSGQTTDQARAENSQVVMGGVDTLSGKIEESKSLRGIAKLKDGITPPTKEYIVFISARPLAGGPPLAVRRMRVDKFPFRFELTESNAMMGGTEFAGLVELTVRLDQLEPGGGSDPLSRLPGDVFGKIKATVGQQNIELILDKKI